ncbi:hypothetical protein QWY79_02480 [Halomonas sabkhae]|uniref:hypothetical protein n=1 Tax=Halomonas sabkhae TaxID=626223 RepID=UPI0025B46A4C|nr:hypothetical protein [Halomonas sabkhae]MDN3524128.1 hypothetical protein [Halomonas sabkhae]
MALDKEFRFQGKNGFSSRLILASLLFSSAVIAQANPDMAGGRHADTEIGRIVQQHQRDGFFTLPDRNIAFIDQLGNDNTALIDQQGTGPNLASVYQSGYGNQASVTQQGAFNIGLVSQKGNHLDATLEQGGREFEAAINQAGINGQVQVSQSGSGYRAITVDQISRSGVGATATIVTR